MSAELLRSGKGKSAGEMPSWPVITVWGGVAQRSDACGPLREWWCPENASRSDALVGEAAHCAREGRREQSKSGASACRFADRRHRMSRIMIQALDY